MTILVASVAGILVLVVGCLVAGLAFRGHTFNVIRPLEAVEERRINKALKVAGPAAKKVDEPQQVRQAVLDQLEKINRELDDMLRRLKKEDLP